MCARYNLRVTPAEAQAAFDLLRAPDWQPRYNIAPTQSVLAIRETDEGRVADPMRWGLIPSWSKEPKTKFPLINARAETVAKQPSFRAPFKRKRCLVPATGFYEWTGSKGNKQPHHIGLQGDEPFAFAGLWDRWGDDLESCTILTCGANALMAPIHDRMPVILPRETWELWLDPDSPSEPLEQILLPHDPDDMQRFAVNRIVNKVGNETPECIEPASSDE